MPSADETLDAGVFFDAYHDRIYRYVLRMTKNPAEAEDITQDTFLRAYSHRDSLRDPDALRGWLYRIATHVCLDRLRQRNPQVSIDSQEACGVASTPSSFPSAIEIAERKETAACVQRCLNFLPDHYRSVILLREAHSLSAAEIADLLDLTVPTVKIRLHRARRMLQGIMQYGCAISKGASGVPACEPKA